MSVAINHYMKPIKEYLSIKGINEVCMNKPGEVFIEKNGIFECIEDKRLDEKHMLGLIDLVAEYNGKKISDRKPMLSATLPTGERCQFVLSPGVERGQLAMSVRAPNRLDLSIEDWVDKGAFRLLGEKSNLKEETRKSIKNALEQGRYLDFIALCIRQKKNIVISGGTSSAKTTFLNSCLKLLDPAERLITIEGVREVKTKQKNTLHLVANEDDPTCESISMLDLLKATLRLRPDRIFLSELRGHEAYPFLRASISGHPGTLTTLHANDVKSAKDQLCFMLSEAKELQNASEKRLRHIVDSSIDVIIQLEKRENERVIVDVYIKEG